MRYDYLIVGSGLFGAVFARQMTDAGKRCLVIDKRTVIGGNIRSENVEGIEVHQYGPHIFHTNSEKVWQYINRFSSFNNFTYRPKASFKGKIYSFPVNLLTLYQLWGVQTPAQAKSRLEMERVPDADQSNLRGWILSQVGHLIYETFYEGYTTKQWGRDPSKLPSSIGKRLPIRLTFDDNYFSDKYQGIPVGGYSALAERILDGIEVWTGVDYLEKRDQLDWLAAKVVYTGEIDRYFDYSFGKLEYRSLTFEHETLEGDFQGVAAVNYTGKDIPFTRIVEHKHFAQQVCPNTVITREYPSMTGEHFYPVNDAVNNERFDKYKAVADLLPTVIFGGRLASYKYYDMHQVIAEALHKSEVECTEASK